MRYTEALGTARESTTEPRVIEGTAVPYGVVTLDTEFGREAFAPGAFRDSVAHWSTRQDGGRMAFRPSHGEKPVGVVTELRDTPEGVWFSARIREGERGDEYLASVRDGLNGVSIEPSANDLRNGRRTRDGVMVHRSARLLAIAGSVSPAYDGARIATRDMEEAMAPEEVTPATEAVVAPAAATITQREAVLADAAVHIARPITITRAPLIYGRDAASGPRGEHFGFLSDGYRARNGDGEAAERQHRHEQALNELARGWERDALYAERAGDVVIAEIPGAYPNDYMPGLLDPRILKRRPMGGFFNRMPISDALPKIYPQVTTSTSVAVQAAELTNPAASDFATTAVTVTPLLYGAETVVSRQVLDGSSPGAEAMIMQDMMEAYSQASETVIFTAVDAGASASGVAITKATPYVGTVAQVPAYYAARFNPAEAIFYPAALYSVLLAQLAGDGRPLMPFINPTNNQAQVNSGAVSGNILGADLYLSWASTADHVVTARASDYVVFESSVARFSYDAVTGPAGVRIGIWAYLAVGTRKGGTKVTAA